MRWIKVLLPWLAAVAVCGAANAGAAAQQQAASPVRADVAVGRDVDRAARTLVATAEEFPADVGRVFCLARVVGASAPAEVTFAWYRDGKTMARVTLPVRSADFRTWSSKRIMPAWTGTWEVKVLDAKGQVLGETSFAVGEGGAGAD